MGERACLRHLELQDEAISREKCHQDPGMGDVTWGKYGDEV